MSIATNGVLFRKAENTATNGSIFNMSPRRDGSEARREDREQTKNEPPGGGIVGVNPPRTSVGYAVIETNQHNQQENHAKLSIPMTGLHFWPAPSRTTMKSVEPLIVQDTAS